MKKQWKKNWVIISIIFILVFLIYTFQPIYTTYYVSAITERVTFTTLDNNNSKIHVGNVTVWSDSIVPIHKNIDASIDLHENVKVTVERIGFGVATLFLEHEKSAGELTWVDSLGKENLVQLPSYVEIDIGEIQKKYEQGISQLIRLDGSIELGRKIDYEIKDESTALLKSGEINMIGKTKYLSSTFQAGTKILQEGDQIVIDKPFGKGFGFVNFDDKPGMNLTYRVLSDKARIVKPGPVDEISAGGYYIKASILDRFKNDTLFRIISIIFAIVLVCTSIITFIYDTIFFLRKNN